MTLSILQNVKLGQFFACKKYALLQNQNLHFGIWIRVKRLLYNESTMLQLPKTTIKFSGY
jgi:hypothetical protein